MNPMYYILIGVIVLVVAIDFYVKNKNKKSDSTDIDFPGNISKSNNVLIISAISVVVIIISFFSANYYLYDGELTNSDDGISLIDNIIYQKLSMEYLIEQDSMWLTKNDMSPVSCIVRDKGENIGLIIDGLKEGLWQERYENGQLKYKVNYKNSIIDFSQTNQSWYENGQLKDNIKDNNFTSWHEDGELFEKYSYLNGKINGLYRTWWTNGSKQKEINYKNGKIHGSSSFWRKNGGLMTEKEFVNGDKIKYKHWHKNGRLKFEHFWNNGVKVKTWKGWHDNGKKSYEIIFGNGSKQDWKNWDKNGNRKYNPLFELRKIIEILGCTDKYAVNYDKKSTKNDGSCYFRLGQKYQGGIIFHLNNDKKSGLIAADLDYQKEGAIFHNSSWICSADASNYIGTSKEIGSGKKNTRAIVKSIDLSRGCTNFSANLCSELSHKGYTDWYLPSINEVEKMYNVIGLGNKNYKTLKSKILSNVKPAYTYKYFDELKNVCFTIQSSSESSSGMIWSLRWDYNLQIESRLKPTFGAYNWYVIPVRSF